VVKVNSTIRLRHEDQLLARHEPVFNAPRVVLATLCLLIAAHVVREFLSEETDQWLVLAAAFIPSRYSGDVLPGGDLAKVTSFLTHIALHGDFTHLLVNCGWLLAFGTIVARRIRPGSFLGLSAVSGIAGAALFLACNWGLAQPMAGASGAISGLMGGAIRFMFQPDDPRSSTPAPCMTVAEMMRDQRARLMIGSWIAVNMLFGLVLGQLFAAGGIAWEAHIGGFLAGLLLFPWFDRPNRRTLIASQAGGSSEH
jgi:membrane associated rhomboid family serine protease